MKNTFVYKFGDKLYINLTNRCTNACDFCIRNGTDGIGEDNLWLEREPSAEEVISELKDLLYENYNEVVFCGYGEPTYRLQEIIAVGGFLRAAGKTVRLNTNGHANAIHGRDVTDKLKAAVDIVSISLNAATAQGYQAICNSEYGEAAFDIMLEFARLCVPKFNRTVLSVVDTIGKDEIEKCRKVAEKTGAEFRVREII